MPGFDGTGPAGMGPMTGGARGYCAVPLRRSPSPGPGVYGGVYGRPNYPFYNYFGFGFRRGRGGGRGRRRWWW